MSEFTYFDNILFQSWCENNKEFVDSLHLSDCDVQRVAKPFFVKLWKEHKQKLNQVEKMADSFYENSEQISNKIESILKEFNIPAQDHWFHGIEEIDNYCFDVTRQLKEAREELQQIQELQEDKPSQTVTNRHN